MDFWHSPRSPPLGNDFAELKLSEDILSSSMAQGWVALSPSLPGRPYNLLILPETQTKNAGANVLLSLSGFCGNWTGGFRFAGVTIQRIS